MKKKEPLVCIKCPKARFLNPKKEVCYKTGGLYCKTLKTIVGKYDECHAIKTPRRGEGESEGNFL